MTAVDVSQLTSLANDLGRVPARVVPEAVAVVTKGALNVQQDWRDRWSGLAHAPVLPAAVTFDVLGGKWGSISAEIGPDKERPQGALGNLLEFGSVNNAPTPGGLPAAEAEAPRFAAAVAALSSRLL